MVVFDLFELVWRLKTLTRLVCIGLDPQLSDPFGLKVGAQIPSRISECHIVEGINHTLIRLVWTRAFGPFGLTLDRENGLPIFYINWSRGAGIMYPTLHIARNCR